MVTKATAMPKYEISPAEKVEYAECAFNVGISHEKHYTEALSDFLLRSLGRRRMSLDVQLSAAVRGSDKPLVFYLLALEFFLMTK